MITQQNFRGAVPKSGEPSSFVIRVLEELRAQDLTNQRHRAAGATPSPFVSRVIKELQGRGLVTRRRTAGSPQPTRKKR
jgi:hypothetical protein